MKLTATKEIRFPFIGGKVYPAGAEFEATDAEGQALTICGLATAATSAAPSKRKYQRRDMKAEDSTDTSE